MIKTFKNALCRVSQVYKNKSQQIIDYLDREIAYEQSLKFYTNQRKIKTLPMDYEPYKFDKNIHSLTSMPEPAIEEVIRINKRITEHTWGVILESQRVQDINVYIAQMNKVQINNRNATFFVCTDSESLLLKLHDVFNWMNKVFYIAPNTYNNNISETYRSSINFHCLKHLDKHISTPDSEYMNLLKIIGGKQITVPNPKRVFCFNSRRLVPGL